jgi:hypothetical protein
MLATTIVALVALAVIAFWSRWGFRVMGMFSAFLTPAEPARQRVSLGHRSRNGYEELLREAEWRELEGEQLLQERLQEDDEIARAYLAQLENRSRKTV